MEPVEMAIDGSQHTLHFARSYQLEALEKAIKENTIVFLETGSGKTLIAIMLLRSFAYLIRKPSPNIAVFLVPTVVLVTQQADVVKMHTDLKVGMYWGDMGVDFWDAAMWKKQTDTYEVLVMTPMILLNALRHSFLKLDMIKVLIFDECHNARGRHPYALIMKEFYHHQLDTSNPQHPRILGMTASPIKGKGSSSDAIYWKQICELENLMHSKIYTSVSESVLAQYIQFSSPKLKIYKHVDIPEALFNSLREDLRSLKVEHESSFQKPEFKNSAIIPTRKKLSTLESTLLFCSKELGVWLALKAAESFSHEGPDIYSWGEMDVGCETIVKKFSLNACDVLSKYIPSDPEWSVGNEIISNMNAGYITSKVICLVNSLLEYRKLKDLRCIIFVERVITAIVLQNLLNDLLPNLSGWKTKYIAGNNSVLQLQSRNTQNKVVEEFRKGSVNIIVATSVLEEGLDVQSCNLVVRFDLSATVCSFIQSRGRARMQNSDFLLIVKSDDDSALDKVKNYLASGEIMREQSLRHSSVPCTPLDKDLLDGIYYRVKSTGAIVTLTSSVSLLYFYCSRLPSDGYFKPSPRCEIDEGLEVCTLHLPKSCPMQTIVVHGNTKILKQLACLEACKQLHQTGALTDHLVPDIVMEEAISQELGCEPYVDEQANYVPPELVSRRGIDFVNVYHCYLIELKKNFDYDIPVDNIVLAVRTRLDFDDEEINFDLEVDRGYLSASMRYIGVVSLSSEQVVLCQRFQITLFRVLLDHSLSKLTEVLATFHSRDDLPVFDYLLLPSTVSHQSQFTIDWKSVRSVLPNLSVPTGSRHRVHTKSGLVCSYAIENSLVRATHNGHLYCTAGTLNDLNGNSLLKLKNGEAISYKNYYKSKYGIDLEFEGQALLLGRRIFPVHNHLQRCRQQKLKGPSTNTAELPPELCHIIMSPISVATFYSFSFLPSILHQIESFLIAKNFKKMYLDKCEHNVVIPTIKVLEAITTKRCQEKFHLETLETLGDSFLKYAATQQLFKTYQNQHEGLLSVKRERVICNVSLRKLGCERNLPGFIRNEPFDPKMWIIPGDHHASYILEEEFLSPTKVYNRGRRKIKSKTVADAVEALIGAFLISGGEVAAIKFMDWLGIKVDFDLIRYERHFPVQPERLVNIKYVETLLNYSFNDASLLVEALTHGSYMLPEIPRCYERLEFLGDSVLDYLITLHLCDKYPGSSPGLLTGLRSASVNNDTYAQCAVKAGLHKHILHASQELHKQIVLTVNSIDQSSLESTFGYESETKFPKVLGDIIESLAGAILVDCGYNVEVVFNCIRPLLEPLVTPETLKLHPVSELTDLCHKHNFNLKKPVLSNKNGVASITIEVEANGVVHGHSCTEVDKKTAKKLASKILLKSLKESISRM